MRRFLWLLGVAAILAGAAQPAMAKSPGPDDPVKQGFSDNLPSPLSTRQAALKVAAQQAVLTGQATAQGADQIVNLHHGRGGKYVQLAFQGEDQILTLLGQFGSGQAHHADDTTPGPLHNQIPAPDRTQDNTTIWQADFNREHYQSILFDKNNFPSMANYYLESSSGQYSVDGYVSDWVDVPYNESSYGSDYCGSIVCADTWYFLQDQANAWWDEMVAEMGEQGAKDFLAQYDHWDRYDYNGNGNFDEPDGYIDHFQSIHAGDGEETGGGAQGSDAIWSHRWYAFYNLIGTAGPDGNPAGGIEIGDSGTWIGDYTIEPENGGVGVFAHEFGHDLGLPDEYDTSGNSGGAENSTGWWTNWSQGSYGTQDEPSLGNYPVAMTTWERFELGFLNKYVVVTNTESRKVGLGPAEYNTHRPQALFVILPDREYDTNVGDPFAGTKFYYSGAANSLTTSMTRQVTLPASGDTLTAKVRYNIEEGYDYAVLTVNGNTVPSNLSNSTVTADGIEGDSGGWVDLTADLSAYAGQTVTIGFAYVTDGGQQGVNGGGTVAPGFAVDELSIPGQPTDGAETDPGWTFDTNNDNVGFHITNGTEQSFVFNAYVVENRQYIGYDDSLRLGPYNFGFADNANRQNFVEHFPYRNGVLVWYWNTKYDNNNVGDHPGEGEILPVDSHPAIMHWSDGTEVRPRINSYDSTFTIKPTKSITLHRNSVPTTFPSQPGVRVFNDMNDYYVASDPADTGHYQAAWNSVQVPHTGFSFRIKILNYKRAVLILN